MRLPMLYEASYVLPDVEGDPKRAEIFDEPSARAGSRSDTIYEHIIKRNPSALDVEIRLMRPNEIRQEIPFEERMRRDFIRAMMFHIHMIAEMEKKGTPVQNGR